MPIAYFIDRKQRPVVALLSGVLTDADVFDYEKRVWTRADVQGTMKSATRVPSRKSRSLLHNAFGILLRFRLLWMQSPVAAGSRSLSPMRSLLASVECTKCFGA